MNMDYLSSVIPPNIMEEIRAARLKISKTCSNCILEWWEIPNSHMEIVVSRYKNNKIHMEYLDRSKNVLGDVIYSDL